MSIDEVKETVVRNIPTLPGWCTPEKGSRMAEVCVGAHDCVELGVFGGRGLVSMALPLKDQGFGRAYGIDPYTAQAALEGTNHPVNIEWWTHLDYEQIAKRAQMAIDYLGLTAHAWLLRARSAEASRMFLPASLDVLHQDSNHSEEVSCEEITLWVPKMRPGAYWIFDDTDWPTTKKAQKMLLDRGFVELEDHVQWKIYRVPGSQVTQNQTPGEP